MISKMLSSTNPAYYDFSEQELKRIDPSQYPDLFDETIYESDEFRMYGFKIKRSPPDAQPRLDPMPLRPPRREGPSPRPSQVQLLGCGIRGHCGEGATYEGCGELKQRRFGAFCSKRCHFVFKKFGLKTTSFWGNTCLDIKRCHFGQKRSQNDPHTPCREASPQHLQILGCGMPRLPQREVLPRKDLSFCPRCFEYWLHPAKYRTRPCNAGELCRRKVCFFAHTAKELRDETKYHYVYHVRSNDRDAVGKVSYGGNRATPSSATPLVPVDPATRVNGTLDFLASLSGLTIREGASTMGDGIFSWCVPGSRYRLDQLDGGVSSPKLPR